MLMLILWVSAGDPSLANGDLGETTIGDRLRPANLDGVSDRLGLATPD